MNASKLIEELQKMINQYGDQEVCFGDFDGGQVDIKSVVPRYLWKPGQPFVDDIEAGVAFFELK
jgi:hypothetical protein